MADVKRNRIKERAKKIPLETKKMIEMSLDISNRIYLILDQQNKTQKDLAKLLGKKESEISKWLSGTHNFTLKSIAKIEIALGESLTSKPTLINIHKFMFTSNNISELYIPSKPKHYQKIKDLKSNIKKSFTASNQTLLNEDLFISECSEN